MARHNRLRVSYLVVAVVAMAIIFVQGTGDDRRPIISNSNLYSPHRSDSYPAQKTIYSPGSSWLFWVKRYTDHGVHFYWGGDIDVKSSIPCLQLFFWSSFRMAIIFTATNRHSIHFDLVIAVCELPLHIYLSTTHSKSSFSLISSSLDFHCIWNADGGL